MFQTKSHFLLCAHEDTRGWCEANVLEMRWQNPFGFKKREEQNRCNNWRYLFGKIAPCTIEEHQRYEGHHGSDDTKGDWEGYFLGSFNSRLGWIHPSA